MQQQSIPKMWWFSGDLSLYHRYVAAEDRWSALVNKSELFRAYIWGVKGSPGIPLLLRNKDLRGYIWCWRKRSKDISPCQTQFNMQPNSSVCYSVSKIGKDSHNKICKNGFLFQKLFLHHLNVFSSRIFISVCSCLWNYVSQVVIHKQVIGQSDNPRQCYQIQKTSTSTLCHVCRKGSPLEEII